MVNSHVGRLERSYARRPMKVSVVSRTVSKVEAAFGR